MGNILEGVLHIGLFVDRHTLRDQQGKSAFPEILQQDFLALHRFQVLGQIIQQVILGFRCGHAKHGGHHQRKTHDDDQDSVLDQSLCESFHICYLPTHLLFQNMVLTIST